MIITFIEKVIGLICALLIILLIYVACEELAYKIVDNFLI